MARPALDRVRLVPMAVSLRQQGWPSRMIATRLGVSERTVKSMLTGTAPLAGGMRARRAAMLQGAA